jgi:hypothetical protein
MRTPEQIEAARRNGGSRQEVRPYPRNALRAGSACGQGPKTPEGKRRSARNATTHGLLAKTIVLEGESATRFSNLLAGLIAEHQPRTTTEPGLVEAMAVNRWRQMRLWSMEKAGITYELHKQAAPNAELPDDPPTRTTLAMSAMNNDRSLETILRYEARFAAAQQRALRALDQLRLSRVRRGEPLIPSPVPMT